MTIHRKPRKSPLDTFETLLVPERIHEAYARVESYFTESLALSFETPEGASGVLNELIRQHGETARVALTELLCEPQATFRSLLEAARMGEPAAAVAALVPVVSNRYALAPAVALLISTLVVKAVSAGGQQAICEELTRQHRKAARKQRSGEARRKGKISAARRDAEVTRARRAAVKRRTPARTKRP